MAFGFRRNGVGSGSCLGAAAGTVFASAICFLVFGLPGSALAFEVNGRHWDEMPIPIWVNPSGAPDMGLGASPEEVVLQAAAAWEGVGCAQVSFQVMGTTDATLAPDGKNVVYWAFDVWQFQEDAAGATIWIPKQEGETPEVDLALNAVKYEWTVGGGNALQSDVVDPVSVIAHELGHWLGLSHTPDPFATMYFALLPNGIQSTVSPDDKAGLCSLYPSGSTAECEVDEDCPQDAASGATGVCNQVGELRLCGEHHDSTGDSCAKTHINCDGMCWAGFADCSSLCIFTSFDYSVGYCSEVCVDDSGCPPGYHCKEFPQYEIQACVTGGEPDPDASDPEAVESIESAEVVEEWADVAELYVEPLEPIPELVESEVIGADSLPTVDDGALVADPQNDAVAPGTGSGASSGCSASPWSGAPSSFFKAPSSHEVSLLLLLVALFVALLPRILSRGA